jgi:UPF0755 protein
MDIESRELTKNNSIRKISYVVSIFFILFLVVLFFIVFLPTNKEIKVINISSGESLNLVIKKMKSENIINNEIIFKSIFYLISKDRKIVKGDYKFDKGSSVFSVALQLANNKHNIEPIKITFKEGITKKEVIYLLENNFKNFDKNKFLSNEKMKEGYIFPDTYIIFPSTSTDEIIQEIYTNFDKKIKSVQGINNNKSINQIITMASILEKEAKGESDIYLISGILWKRIEIGMPMQADAAMETYKIKGLPETPISNPGLLSIKAALNPLKSNYLYYLHDKNGNVHFAVDYKEHIDNIKKYLK